MSGDALSGYREVWFTDFEFHQPTGDRPTPICMVAREYRSGRSIREWLWDSQPTVVPFSVDEDSLFVAYFASAELSCFLALDWPIPTGILDLFTEFRCGTNGLATMAGNGLLGALAHFGLGAMDAAEKTEMRDLAIRGGPYTEVEQAALVEYCESDVLALARLLPAMLPSIDLPRALLRGRYMAAVARMEAAGPNRRDDVERVTRPMGHDKGATDSPD